MPSFFFFNDPATTEIYPLSLHDALPIYWQSTTNGCACWRSANCAILCALLGKNAAVPAVHLQAPERSAQAHRSEEHTSELQSRLHLVCRLLLEKKKAHEHRPLAPSTSGL